MTAFTQALERFGWAQGKNIQIDYRFAAGDPALYKAYAAEIVGLVPDAILAGSSPAVAALRQETRTVPIVFAAVGDPVGQGFVQSLARPDGNITGFSSPDAPLYGKWLQLLKEIAPSVSRVAVIFNPDATPTAALFNLDRRDRGRRLISRDYGDAGSGSRRFRDRGSHRHPGARAGRRPNRLPGCWFYHDTSSCDHRRCNAPTFAHDRLARCFPRLAA